MAVKNYLSKRFKKCTVVPRQILFERNRNEFNSKHNDLSSKRSWFISILDPLQFIAYVMDKCIGYACVTKSDLSRPFG